MTDLCLRALQARLCLSGITIAATLLAQPAVHAQTDADRALIANARTHYLPGPVPGTIACDVQLDWDRFFAALNVPQTDAAKARMATLKKLQMTVVSKDATHTEVKLSGTDPSTAQVSQGLQQQIEGFFQIYWSMAYGNALPSSKEQFHLSSDAQGHTIETTTGATSSSAHMDSSFALDRMAVDSPQMKVDVTPEFKPGDDNLLRMRSLHETINLGSSRMELNVELDYQGVGKYEIPQHIAVSIPGAFAFNYLLTNCKVDPPVAENAAAPVAPAK